MEDTLVTTHPIIFRIILLSTLVTGAGVLNTATAAPPAYTVTDLGTLGGTYGSGWGINSSGQVTGVSATTGGAHAFLWTPTTSNGVVGAMLDLGTLGGIYSQGSSINASGLVTGYADTTGNAAHHAFLYDGAMHDLGTLGGRDSYGLGINASGQVIGESTTAGDAVLRAFLYDGVLQDLGTLGGTSSTGAGINASGQVTGFAQTDNLFGHAFLYDGTMRDLGTFDGTDSSGTGINEGGQVTGAYFSIVDLEVHAFLWTPTEQNGTSGMTQDLGTLGGTYSAGRGINASGQVTGDFRTSAGVLRTHAFLYASGSGMVDLNSLIDPLSGWELAYGSAINDAGQITGYGYIGGQQRAFLLNPVPEPAGLALLALGLSFLIWSRSRGPALPLAV